jgi:hypothetical protein
MIDASVLIAWASGGGDGGLRVDDDTGAINSAKVTGRYVCTIKLTMP